MPTVPEAPTFPSTDAPMAAAGPNEPTGDSANNGSAQDRREGYPAPEPPPPPKSVLPPPPETSGSGIPVPSSDAETLPGRETGTAAVAGAGAGLGAEPPRPPVPPAAPDYPPPHGETSAVTEPPPPPVPPVTPSGTASAPVPTGTPAAPPGGTTYGTPPPPVPPGPPLAAKTGGAKMNLLGYLALAFGIVGTGCCCCPWLDGAPFIGGIPAIILGAMHLSRVKKGQASMSWLAWVGIVLGVIAIVGAICGLATDWNERITDEYNDYIDNN